MKKAIKQTVIGSLKVMAMLKTKHLILLIFGSLLSACGPDVRFGNSIASTGSCSGARGCDSINQTESSGSETEEPEGVVEQKHPLQDRSIIATKCYINGELVLSALGNIVFPGSSWTVVRRSPAESYHGSLDLLTNEPLTLQSAGNRGTLSGIPLGKIHLEFKAVLSGEILLQGEAECVEVPVSTGNGPF